MGNPPGQFLLWEIRGRSAKPHPHAGKLSLEKKARPWDVEVRGDNQQLINSVPLHDWLGKLGVLYRIRALRDLQDIRGRYVALSQVFAKIVPMGLVGRIEMFSPTTGGQNFRAWIFGELAKDLLATLHGDTGQVPFLVIWRPEQDDGELGHDAMLGSRQSRLPLVFVKSHQPHFLAHHKRPLHEVSVFLQKMKRIRLRHLRQLSA